MKDTVGAVSTWLLKEQYVCISEQDQRLWKVARGNGMGLKHSSYIADLTFATLGDEWACSKAAKQAFGISCIKRFRDDLLVISSKPEKMYYFFKRLRARVGSAFTLEIPGVSQHSVTMLAVTITIEHSRVVCRPREREQHVPLTWDSPHPPTVHRWWPLGHGSSMRNLCTRRKEWNVWRFV